ncbi:unnamed protein product, partial [Thlaspi arvense]
GFVDLGKIIISNPSLSTISSHDSVRNMIPKIWKAAEFMFPLCWNQKDVANMDHNTLKLSSATTSKAPEKLVFHNDSSKEIQVQNDSRATATLETETDEQFVRGFLNEQTKI